MLAARPSNRSTGTATPPPASGSPTPQVRDYASPAAGYAIEWDVRPVYDFLFSLNDDPDFPHDLAEVDRRWLDESRAALQAERPDDVETLLAAEMPVFVAAFAVEHPELETVDAFLDALETVPTPDLLTTILCDLARDPDLGTLVQAASTGGPKALEALRDALPDHKLGFQTLLRDPEAGHRRLVEVLRAWAVPFATIEPRIRAIIERDHAIRAVDRGAQTGTVLIERTTGGIRWLPEVGIRRVILAPTYFSRPYNILLAGPDWRFFAYPVADDALEVEDRLAPPPSVIRLHRALGDDTRLRILKLLAGQDLYLTEIAQHLDLSKPTIKHHLAQLRAAGLVTVVEAGSVIYYSLRRDRIEAASGDLARFLRD
jgi:DNA-binding transcriptional ArsR family regulator